jgi:hypothetical protein
VAQKTENGRKQSVTFAEDVDQIIEDYRSSKRPIPSFTDAVNELIRKGGAKND